jgi:hypothetical protein
MTLAQMTLVTALVMRISCGTETPAPALMSRDQFERGFNLVVPLWNTEFLSVTAEKLEVMVNGQQRDVFHGPIVLSRADGRTFFVGSIYAGRLQGIGCYFCDDGHVGLMVYFSDGRIRKELINDGTFVGKERILIDGN